MQPAPERKLSDSAPSLLTSKETSIDVVRRTVTGELVIALVGPIGSDLHTVAERLRTIVTTEFHYQAPPIIRLSDFIEQYRPPPKPDKSHFERVMRLIDGGNDLRFHYNPGVLAELAIHTI